ncbi:MAG: MFS transporter, partial [Anaerolineales bacterium]|nr:MFS transporter [Anaerolineales bacterium]
LRSLLFVSTAIGILFGLNNALLLPFADRALQATETEYGLIEAFSMVGFVVGSLWMARVAERLREGQWLALSYLGMGAVSVVYSQIDSISIAIALGLVSTFANVPSFLAGRLIRQRHTTSEIRGRVTSVFIVVIETTFMIGMGLAGLADFFDIRMMFLLQGILLVGVGLIVLVLPGLGQPASEWKQAIALLRGVANAPGLSTGRSATMGDIEMFAARLPAVASLKTAEKQKLITGMRYLEADVGTVIMRHHEISDSAYFILEGRAFAGRTENGEETVLEVLNAGAFFGEIAALTGIPRTANIVVEQPAVLLQVPAATLREMAAIPEMNRVFMSKMTERMIRMNMLDTPKALGLDQTLARELRTEDPTSATIPPFVSSTAQSFG